MAARFDHRIADDLKLVQRVGSVYDQGHEILVIQAINLSERNIREHTPERIVPLTGSGFAVLKSLVSGAPSARAGRADASENDLSLARLAVGAKRGGHFGRLTSGGRR